jgi:hypothetical protein
MGSNIDRKKYRLLVNTRIGYLYNKQQDRCKNTHGYRIYLEIFDETVSQEYHTKRKHRYRYLTTHSDIAKRLNIPTGLYQTILRKYNGWNFSNSNTFGRHFNNMDDAIKAIEAIYKHAHVR